MCLVREIAALGCVIVSTTYTNHQKRKILCLFNTFSQSIQLNKQDT